MRINMSLNASSLSDPSAANSCCDPLRYRCYMSTPSRYVFLLLAGGYVLLLPFPVLVLYLGCQQWRKRHSFSSNSDIFIHHSITMQLGEILGFFLVFAGEYFNQEEALTAGLCIWCLTSVGHIMFHLLACAERYMAVNHPITYLSLRQTRRVRIRNTSIGLVWVQSFFWVVLYYYCDANTSLILYLCLMAFFLSTISFFCVSVLYALRRGGPGGEVGGNRECVDQSKQKAFYTILAVMVTVMLRLIGNLLCSVLDIFLVHTDVCLITLSRMWVGLPSSSFLWLFFLHREGKLKCCRANQDES